jgi:hypothetical protein
VCRRADWSTAWCRLTGTSVCLLVLPKTSITPARPTTLATVPALVHHPSAGDSPVFVAITDKIAMALVGLEPTRPGAKDFKSGARRSTAIHRLPLPPSHRGKAPVFAPPTSTDLPTLGYTLATLLWAPRVLGGETRRRRAKRARVCLNDQHPRTAATARYSPSWPPAGHSTPCPGESRRYRWRCHPTGQKVPTVV